MSSYIENLSVDERQEFIKLAQIERKRKREELIEYATKHYRTYEDEKEWREMASKVGVRLPRWYDQPTPKNLKKFAKKLGKDSAWIKENFGVDKLEDIAKMNPQASMLVHAGMMLEDYLY